MTEDHEDLDSSDGADRRAFYRVLTRIPVQCRSVSAREADALLREIPQSRAPKLAQLDEGLAHWLDRIERKLDRILVHMGIGDSVAFTDADVQEVLLSGSGMSLTCPERIEAGGRMLVELELPGLPARVVRSLAQVIRRLAPKQEGEPEATAISFEVIHESDREAIVQHVVEVQRQLLRARNSA